MDGHATGALIARVGVDRNGLSYFEASNWVTTKSISQFE
jgi:hypothetical protein